tara:strand:- start:748 stop:1290 length:543 start_codon:yes stop_codon:yes gene_type:complete
MQVKKTEFDGLLILKPKIFKDEIGLLFESWNESVFKSYRIIISFILDNQSVLKKNALRELHFQNHPYRQGKLISMSKGSVIDIALDIIKYSKTYEKHFKYKLSDQNATMLWISYWFAYGFITLENQTVFQYKCDSSYHPEYEECITWNDPSLEIDWRIKNPIVSSKDQEGKLFIDIHLNY